MTTSPQTIPTWIQITLGFLGSGGLIGASAIIFNLFKQVTDAKDTDIKRLQNEVEFLERNHESRIQNIRDQYNEKLTNIERALESKKEELERISDFRKLFEKTIHGLNREEITSETRNSLMRIESYFSSMQSSQEILNGMETAARWVEYRKSEWLEQAVKAATEQYQSDLLPLEKTPLFREDIKQYLSWLQDSLLCGFFCRLEDYVGTPAIDSPFPYRAAFKAIGEAKDFGNLSPSESEDLQDYIDELARFTRTQNKNSI